MPKLSFYLLISSVSFLPFSGCLAACKQSSPLQFFTDKAGETKALFDAEVCKRKSEREERQKSRNAILSFLGASEYRDMPVAIPGIDRFERMREDQCNASDKGPIWHVFYNKYVLARRDAEGERDLLDTRLGFMIQEYETHFSDTKVHEYARACLEAATPCEGVERVELKELSREGVSGVAGDSYVAVVQGGCTSDSIVITMQDATSRPVLAYPFTLVVFLENMSSCVPDALRGTAYAEEAYINWVTALFMQVKRKEAMESRYFVCTPGSTGDEKK